MITFAERGVLIDLVRDRDKRIPVNPNTLKYLGGNALTLFAGLSRGRIQGDFRGLNLSGADLTGVDLSDVKFEYAIFEECKFERAVFRGTCLDGAQIVRCDFDRAHLTGVKINGNAVVCHCSNLHTAEGVPPEFRTAIALSEGNADKGSQARTFRPPMIDRLTKMRIVDGGRFFAGVSHEKAPYSDPWEGPEHEVVVRPFAIDLHPVSNEQFHKFVDANPEWGKTAVVDRLKNAYYLKLWDDNNEPPDGKGQLPVVYVSWFAAAAYAQWAGKRLVTEAEWEFALRDGYHAEQRVYPWGNTFDETPEAYIKLIEMRTTVPSDETPPSPNYGLYSMSGNVNEWVSDWFGRAYFSYLREQAMAGNIVDCPSGPEFGTERVFRGGSFLSGIGANAHELTCFYRRFLFPQNTNQDMGFRCAMDVESCRYAGLVAT